MNDWELKSMAQPLNELYATKIWHGVADKTDPFLHCVFAHELWSLIFCFFWVAWVMPCSVMELLACWEGSFGKGRI